MMTPEERRKAVDAHIFLKAADLAEIAAGPIVDPGRVYLPAGKLSEAEYQARERRIRNGEPI